MMKMNLNQLEQQRIQTGGQLGPFSVPNDGSTQLTVSVDNPTYISDPTYAGIEVALSILWSWQAGDNFPTKTTVAIEGGTGGKAAAASVSVPTVDPSGNPGRPIQWQLSHAPRRADTKALTAIDYGCSCAFHN